MAENNNRVKTGGGKMIEIKRGFGIRLLASFAIIVFLLTSAISVFAQDIKAAKGYTYNLKQLMEQAEKNIKKVDENLKEKEIEKRNQQRESEAIGYFEKGNVFYKEGKLKDAKKEWQKALEITKDPQMKNYLRDNEKKARKEELARKKDQKKKQDKLKAEQREKERLERERQKQLELEKKKKLRQQKEAQTRLAKKQKEQKRLKKQEELTRKKEESQRQKRLATERKEKEVQLKKEKREKEQSEKKRQRQLERQKKKEEHRAEKRKKAIQHVEEIAKPAKEEPMVRLEDLTYRTEKECLDILSEDPKNKEVYNNLVNLYVLKDELLGNATELYKNKDYQGAIQEYNKALSIEPENKKAKTGIKRAHSRKK